jgi:hypothetical protein
MKDSTKNNELYEILEKGWIIESNGLKRPKNGFLDEPGALQYTRGKLI